MKRGGICQWCRARSPTRPSVRRGAAGSAERTLHCIVCCPRIADQAGSAIAHVSTYKGDRQPEGQGCRRLWRGAAYSESGAFFGSKVVSPGQGYPPCVLKPGPGVATTAQAVEVPGPEREAIHNMVRLAENQLEPREIKLERERISHDKAPHPSQDEWTRVGPKEQKNCRPRPRGKSPPNKKTPSRPRSD